MAENPYSELIHIVRDLASKEQVASWRIGEVVTVSPLIISVANHNLKGKDLLCNEFLLNAEGEQYRIKVGNQVLMIPSSDGQQYVVICKVVNG